MKILQLLIRLSSDMEAGQAQGQTSESSVDGSSPFLDLLKEKLGSSSGGGEGKEGSDPFAGIEPGDLPAELVKAMQTLKNRKAVPGSSQFGVLFQLLQQASGRVNGGDGGVGSLEVKELNKLFNRAFQDLSSGSLQSLNEDLEQILQQASSGDLEQFMKALEQSRGTIQESIGKLIRESGDHSIHQRSTLINQLKRFFEQIRQLMKTSRKQLRKALGQDVLREFTPSSETPSPVRSDSSGASNQHTGASKTEEGSDAHSVRALDRIIDILRNMTETPRTEAETSETRTVPNKFNESLKTVLKLLSEAVPDPGTGSRKQELSSATIRQMKAALNRFRTLILNQGTTSPTQPETGSMPAGEVSDPSPVPSNTGSAAAKRSSVGPPVTTPQGNPDPRSQSSTASVRSVRPHPPEQPTLRTHLQAVLSRGQPASETSPSSRNLFVQALLRLSGDPGVSGRESGSMDLLQRTGAGNSDGSRPVTNRGSADRQVGIMSSYEQNSSSANHSMDFTGQGFFQGQQSRSGSPRAMPVQNRTGGSSTPFQTAREARQFIDRMVKQAKTVIKGNRQSMTLQLEPRALGRLHLKVQVEAGQVTAHFEVEHSGVKQTLLGRIDHLKQSLQQMGLQVDQIDISDVTPEGGRGDGQSFQSFHERTDEFPGGGSLHAGESETVGGQTPAGRRLREYSTFERVA